MTVYMYVCMYVRMYVCEYVCKYMCICLCMYVCVYMYLFVCVCARACMRAREAEHTTAFSNTKLPNACLLRQCRRWQCKTRRSSMVKVETWRTWRWFSSFLPAALHAIAHADRVADDET